MITEFTIDRKVWLRGEPGCSYLLREIDGKRCCIGIFLSACGVPDELLEGQGSPGGLMRSHPDLVATVPDWLFETRYDYDYGNSPRAQSLMGVNDDNSTPDWNKELFITEMFAEHGVKVVFL